MLTSLENPFMTPQPTGTTYLSPPSPVIAAPLPRVPPPVFLNWTPRPPSHSGRYRPLLPTLSDRIHSKASWSAEYQPRSPESPEPAPSPANASSPADFHPESVSSCNITLDLLASVALARDDEPALDVFNDGDNIDGCTPEQVKYFGVLSEIYRAADVIGQATNKIRTAQLSGTAPLAEVIMVSMLEKGYLDILEAVTGGAFHHLRDWQIGEFLAPTVSQLLERIKPKQEPVIPELKTGAGQDVQWNPPLEFLDNAMVFKEVSRRLGMAANGSTWEALLQNASWAGLGKDFHNALYTTDPIPAVPFVPIPESNL
ncbi:hypothetical protein M404DRAFT_31145 [Pisolithus tinctorius Marx 270]|uniref:Uncharacterized protein n=1 Tax=Pisolithus tinctorius Marx 270 TaxID=870435 RepID=A0A0C3NTT2_PISTI|nr:hypothetical protein M404DRAFT_31145 [Pisolithus tinctorius Marx 270]